MVLVFVAGHARITTFFGGGQRKPCFLVCQQLYPVSLDVLLHIVSLNKPPGTREAHLTVDLLQILCLPLTVGTLVWFVSAVDLPVPVETAGISQLLPAHLALDGWFTVGPNLPGSTFIKMFKFLPESCCQC